MGILSAGYLSGPFLGAQIGLAILTFAFGMVESVLLVYWNYEVQGNLDPITRMV